MASNGGGGFLSNFAYGFSQTAKPIIEDEAKAQAQADAVIREKIQSVDPEAELYQRKIDIDAAQKQKDDQSKLNNNLTQYQQFMDQSRQQPTATPDNSVLAPSPTITTPSMAPTPNASQPFTPTKSVDDLYNDIHKANTLKAVGDLQGNKALSAAADTQRADAQAELDRSKRNKEDNVNTLTAADGVNVPDYATKIADKNNAKPQNSTIYQTGSLKGPISEQTIPEEERIATDIHSPLIASYMVNHPNNKEVSSVIYNKTLPVAQAIATIQSQDAPDGSRKAATIDEKYKATQVLGDYLHANVKTVDDNLHHIITPDLSSNIDTILQQHSGQSISAPTNNSNSGWSIKPVTPPPAAITQTVPRPD